MALRPTDERLLDEFNDEPETRSIVVDEELRVDPADDKNVEGEPAVADSRLL